MNLGIHPYKSKSGKTYNVNAGYDIVLNYAFMVVFDEEDNMLYSNMSEVHMLDIKDFSYFRELANKKFDIELLDIEIAIQVFKENTSISLSDYKKLLVLKNLSKFEKTVSY